MTISPIQYITQDNDRLSHAQQAKLMFENGINWVQLRMKNASKTELLEQAKEAMTYADGLCGMLIINDHIDVCLEAGAHGVHLGLNDMPVNEARKILGAESIIGGTANTIEDIEKQAQSGADYIGLGPFRYTTTKENLSPLIGLEGYKNLVEEMKIRNITVPVLAVGGITMDDISDLKAVGLFGVAISTGLLNNYRLL